MRYSGKEVWVIEALEAYRIIRNCPKCHEKTEAVSTGCFRVNANGGSLDVWLIYQCGRCKTSFNLPVFSRVHVKDLDPELTRRFSENDPKLALAYGLDREFFKRCHAVIRKEPPAFELRVHRVEPAGSRPGIVIRNPYGLRLRLDRLLAEGLGISRAAAGRLIREGVLYNEQMKIKGSTLAIDGLELVAREDGGTELDQVELG